MGLSICLNRHLLNPCSGLGSQRKTRTRLGRVTRDYSKGHPLHGRPDGDAGMFET